MVRESARTDAIRRALWEFGYIEGQNTTEYLREGNSIGRIMFHRRFARFSTGILLVCRHCQMCWASERERTTRRSHHRSAKRRHIAARAYNATQGRIVGKVRHRVACDS